MPEGTDLFEIIHTTRAMRRLKPDPVPDELIRKILLAGQAAASGGNTQPWRFLVLKDQKIKKAGPITSGPSTRWSDRATRPARHRRGRTPPDINVSLLPSNT
jgi:hypothetical protein